MLPAPRTPRTTSAHVGVRSRTGRIGSYDLPLTSEDLLYTSTQELTGRSLPDTCFQTSGHFQGKLSHFVSCLCMNRVEPLPFPSGCHLSLRVSLSVVPIARSPPAQSAVLQEGGRRSSRVTASSSSPRSSPSQPALPVSFSHHFVPCLLTLETDFALQNRDSKLPNIKSQLTYQ